MMLIIPLIRIVLYVQRLGIYEKYHGTCDICTGLNIFNCDYKIRIFPTLIVFNKISYTMYHDAIKKTHNK